MGSKETLTPARILLIPDKFHWILGTIAKEIVRYNPGIAFAFATRSQVRQNPERVIQLAQSVDAIHWIIDLEFFKTLPDELAHFTKTIASVHHVLDWDLAQKCRTASLIHTVSHEWKEYLIDKGIEAERIHIIPNGVDILRFNPNLSKSSARRLFGIPESCFVVGFFGSAHPLSRGRKGVDTFLQSVVELQKRIPELLLFISGQNWGDDVQSLVRQGIRVFHPGFLPSSKLPAAYRALDAFVVASTVEGGPVTAFEAMASGVPLISTSVGMVRDAVVPGYHALIIPANQADELASAVLKLYSDTVLREQLANNGVMLAQEHYQWAHVAPKYGELYRLLLGQTASANESTAIRDPFLAQRKQVLIEDSADLVLSQWERRNWRAALELLSDTTGFRETMSVLKSVVLMATNEYVCHIYNRLPPVFHQTWKSLKVLLRIPRPNPKQGMN